MNKETIELKVICNTTYYYYRFWIKPLFLEAGIEKFKFVKNENDWGGKVEVPVKSLKKCLGIFSKWEKENKECETPWQICVTKEKTS